MYTYYEYVYTFYVTMCVYLYLVYRSGKQCRERWHNHLDPGIKKVRIITIHYHTLTILLYTCTQYVHHAVLYTCKQYI